MAVKRLVHIPLRTGVEERNCKHASELRAALPVFRLALTTVSYFDLLQSPDIPFTWIGRREVPGGVRLTRVIRYTKT